MKYDKHKGREFWKEITRAWERITHTQGGPMGWVTNFAQRDIEALAPSEWSLLAFEVAAFAFHFPIKTWTFLNQEEAWSVPLFPEGKGLPASVPSRKDGQELQAMLLSHFDQYFSTRRIVATFPKLTLEIEVEDMPALNRKALWFGATLDRVGKKFEYCFIHLFAEHAGLIQRCPECSRIFLAKRFDQVFCNPRCQMRVASRKWRSSHLPKSDMRVQHNK